MRPHAIAGISGLLGLCAVGLLSVLTCGCGMGDGDDVFVETSPSPAVNVASTVAVLEPALDKTVSRGGTFLVAHQADDPDDVALTSLYLDGDGDVGTQWDQYTIAEEVDELDGTVLSDLFEWDPFDVPAGTYHVIAITSDGTNEAAVAVSAGTLLFLANASWAKRAGGTLGDGAVAVDALADGSSIVAGHFEVTATFGPGEASETTLTSAGGFDVFVARYNADGTLAWAKRAGGTDNDIADGVTALTDGSLIVVGHFEGKPTFGLGETIETMLTSPGGFDVFVARYDADGVFVWAERAGGTGSDAPSQVFALGDGSSLVVGHFDGSATFGSGEAGATVLTSAGESDVFVARYGAGGTLAWARRAGGTELDSASGVSAAADGASIVVGAFKGISTFGLGEVGQTTLTSAGDSDAFLARFGADGTLAWAKRAGGTGRDEARSVSALPDGSWVVVGGCGLVATFGLGEPGGTTLIGDSSFNPFVARYDADGALTWAKGTSASTSAVWGAVGALPDGSSIVGGFLANTATYGPGEANETTLTSPTNLGDAIVARYNADGTLAWVEQVGGVGSDDARGVSLLRDGSWIVVGRFEDAVTFGPGDDHETTLTTAGVHGGDLFVARYNADGDF